MFNNKSITTLLLCMFLFFSIMGQVQISYAASVNDVVKTLGSSTMSASTGKDAGSNIFENLFSFIFEKILGPLLKLGGGSASSGASGSGPVKVTPLPSQPGTVLDTGVLKNKVIVVDPGHGGSNPGAVANNTREADNNLAVAMKLREKLAQAGAKVVMTRSTDKTVAAEGSSLGDELQARLDIANANHADLFVSIHSNSNPDKNIAGAMTFYPSGKSQELALDVQTSLIKETGATDKGTSPATFYVLRNAAMPSILVEMGFVTNETEAAYLHDDIYRGKVASGVFNGIVRYYTNN